MLGSYWPSDDDFTGCYFDESRPFYPRTSPDASHASVIEPLSFLLFPDTPIAPIFTPHVVPSSVVPIELPVVPSPSPVEPSSTALSTVVPSFSEDIPQVPMGTAYDSKPPVTCGYTRTQRATRPSTDAPSPLDEPSSSVEPSLDEPSSSAAPSDDETASDACSPRYALCDRQSIRPPDCRII